jgi:hypothetical protein
VESEVEYVRFVAELVPTAIWKCSPELIAALDSRLGEPVDTYVNGSQVWIRDDGPSGATIEWRLHPVASYTRPKGFTTYNVFSRIALQCSRAAELSESTEPAESNETNAVHGEEAQASTEDTAVPTGETVAPTSDAPPPRIDPATLWDGLEVFPAYVDDQIPVAALRSYAIGLLGCEPDACGVVDHESVGNAWEHSQGQRSVIADLLADLDKRLASG